MSNIVWKYGVTVLITAMLISACSGGSEGTGSAPETVTISGNVSAPNGAIAFKQPDVLQRMFAALFGMTAGAAIDGVARVGAGVTVNLIEVDAQGNQVGDVIATATTNAGGEFTLTAPEGFVAASHYVVRAVGTSESIDARVASTVVSVSPVTDAASKLITTTADDLTALDTTELEELIASVDDLSKDIDPTGLSAQALSDALQTQAVNDAETSNVFASAVSTGKICGTVTDANAGGLGNISIAVRDFNNWVTRARTKTSADGSYCLNVPKAGDTNPDTGGTFTGEYILGAVNRTADSSASEWWSAGGVTYSQHEAEKVSVADTTTVVKDFQLENGGTISGTVTADGATLLEGIEIVIRNFDSRTPIASARSDANGTYRVNVIAGTYYVEARNRTAQAFASEVYDGGEGSNNSNDGIPVSITAGNTAAIDFSLSAGKKLSGTVTHGVDGEAVAGRRVMINLQSEGPSVRIRTNKSGQYNIWLKPDEYIVYTYGQRASRDLTNEDQVADFDSDDVRSITSTVLHNDAPVSQAKVRFHSDTGVLINHELSNSDGTVTNYVDGAGDYRVEVRIDWEAAYGSIIYDNHTQLASGQIVTIPAESGTVDLGDINLPDGGALRGTVSNNGAPIANFRVQVRDDDDLSGTSGGVTGNQRFTLVRTRGDGSYIVMLPAGVYDRVKMQDSLQYGTGNGNCDTITIVANQTTTLNYDAATDICSP